MGRRVLVSLAVGAALLTLPAAAAATRPATEQEMAAFHDALVKSEKEDLRCGIALAGGAGASNLGPCQETSRPDYAPQVSEGRVSTLDESWAMAYVAPVPHRGDSAATAVFRKIADGVPETRIVWQFLGGGDGCNLGRGWSPALMPDLVLSMGCTPDIPTKLRCLDKFRRSLLALEEPFNCAVSAPAGFRFTDWMNVRELKWHGWGDEESAWALGVLREVPPGLFARKRTAVPAAPRIAAATPLTPISVRLVASELVSCGTSFFYSKLRVISPFARFSIALPTCPDVFFAPKP